MKLNIKFLAYIFIDLLCLGAAIFLAGILRFDFLVSDATAFFLDADPLYFIITGASAFILGMLFGTYRNLYINLTFHDVFRQAMIVVITCICSWLGHIVFDYPLSGSITIISGFLFFVFTVAVRGIESFYKLILFSRRSTDDISRVIIIGAGNAGSMLIHRLKTHRDMNLVPVAVVDDDKYKRGMTLSGVPVVGNMSQIADIAEQRRADEIIIAIPSASSAVLKQIFDKCKETGLPVKTFGSLLDFHEFMDGKNASLKSLSIEDLLFRDSIKTDMSAVSEYIKGKKVLVTGGAGSIGSEICRQVLEYGCSYLVAMDINENGLFYLRSDLLENYPEERFSVRVGSVRDKVRMDYLFSRHKFDIVFHAAAHKHVPLMEENVFEAVKNNVFGTKNTIECCIDHNVDRFVLISTDKAVNPTNIMGATKRVAELLVRRYSGEGGCEMSAVRFGNVLGSNGSVIPIFRRQIESGGPVTVTHRNIMRYFMTIPEAVSLVLNAGVSANGGEIFVLDMGKPVSIYELACNMIELAGLKLGEDIEIEFTGLRPGEKMFEELKLDSESFTKTKNDKIFVMHTEDSAEKTDADIEKLDELISSDCGEQMLRNAIFETISMDFELCAERGRDTSLFAGIK